MRKTQPLLLLPLFLAAASLLDAQPTPPPSNRARTTKRPPPQTVVRAVGPYRRSYGELLNIHGTGMKRVTAVILGRFAAEIVEQTDELLSVKVPKDPRTSMYESYPILLVPGEPLLNTGTNVIASSDVVVQGPPKVEGKTLLVETTELTQTQSRRFEFEAPEDSSIVTTISASGGGEVEATITRRDDSGEPEIRASYGGALEWELRTKGLQRDGETGPVKLAITLASDAKTPVSVQLKIAEVVRKAAPMPAPGVTPKSRPKR